ncbi:hypothetical protein J3D56_004189 [Erwinia persicina]|jgi:hypothetical protein|uniref:Lipoprotein n=2 Tax=Erwinia TaxID=551 RepID=A0ABV4E249_9GAMM|nr:MULTISPECIES: hypothetical protein [Erwinia]MCP1440753.1 hypothetical protein [Erwinia persicina]MDN8539957.1 hypothetical protein [Erwinia sp. BC051422]
MLMKYIALVSLSLTLAACSNPQPQDKTPSLKICKGFGCDSLPGKPPSRADTHKPTKDEKIRARRGESPDFGSEELNVGGRFPW